MTALVLFLRVWRPADHEGDILRHVFFHSIALACLVGIPVALQAYVSPFTLMVVR